MAKAKWREGMKRKVSAVLLLLWNRSENKLNSCCLVPTHQTSAPLSFASFFNKYLRLDNIFATSLLSLPNRQTVMKMHATPT